MKKLVAASALILTAGLLGAPAVAEEEDPEEPTPGACTKADLAELRAAGDNFADGCFLPGQELAGVDGVQPRLRSGQVDSRRMDKIARSPLQGAFDEESVGSDLAFSGDYAFAGNYDGLTVFDISKPSRPRQVAQLDCPGPQNDVSVYGDVLVMSVDSTRSDDGCASQSAPGELPGAWEGLRVVDISDPTAPEVVANVKTACGSHTHTLAPDQAGEDLYVYVSSYGPSRTTPNCRPPHDAISVVDVPLDDPASAAVASTPVLFPNGGYDGDDVGSATSGCHDITAYPSKDLAAGACMGDGILLDISDRARPKVIDRVRDTKNFAFWHSATFNDAGTKVVFTDELGGGGSATCNKRVGPKRGADGIYDIRKARTEPTLAFRSYYKMPRTQSNTENCVAHNGSLIPVAGRDIMVQAWYQGGISVFDFTDSRKPRELAYFDRGAISDDEFVLGGFWSAYWYNGHVYGNDITRGLEVFDIDARFARKASKVRLDSFNAQSQPSFNG